METLWWLLPLVLALVIGGLCPLAGTLLLVQRRLFLANLVSHAVLPGLALALALSSLSSRQTQVESLFIDEGFGTLDPDSLDLALSSLDSLQAAGRQIGVISHVQTLVERIGVQIRVEALGGGESRVVLP